MKICMNKYVDDSTLVEICSKGSASVLQQSANIGCQLSFENDMNINSNKTQEMLICFCKSTSHASNLPNIVVNKKPVDRFTQTKLLGVMISSDLTWNVHVARLHCR